MFSSPKKIVHSTYRHQMFARLIKKHSAIINPAVLNWKWVYSWSKTYIGLLGRLNHLNKHSRWDKWQDKVSFCSLIRFHWRVPARVPLFSLGLKVPRSPCGHCGRLSNVVFTHYRRREVRDSIYRYRKIHIDYRSKFSYQFTWPVSIIYGNTMKKGWSLASSLKSSLLMPSGFM